MQLATIDVATRPRSRRAPAVRARASTSTRSTRRTARACSSSPTRTASATSTGSTWRSGARSRVTNASHRRQRHHATCRRRCPSPTRRAHGVHRVPEPGLLDRRTRRPTQLQGTPVVHVGAGVAAAAMLPPGDTPGRAPITTYLGDALTGLRRRAAFEDSVIVRSSRLTRSASRAWASAQARSAPGRRRRVPFFGDQLGDQ